MANNPAACSTGNRPSLPASTWKWQTPGCFFRRKNKVREEDFDATHPTDVHFCGLPSHAPLFMQPRKRNRDLWFDCCAPLGEAWFHCTSKRTGKEPRLGAESQNGPQRCEKEPLVTFACDDRGAIAQLWCKPRIKLKTLQPTRKAVLTY